ncbi:MAG: polysaccharide deacetylase family protein [Clostridia bacterium]|nr:polysaccharide deacetylase family protein [Clostridia bacterium]
MAKYLIVNADDFGMCNAANEAVFELFKIGTLRSSTIMMPCPAAKDAVDFSVEHPEYAIGIHTTLTSEWKTYRWKPLTDSPSLLDEEGFMWHETEMVEKNASYEDIEREVRAQIDLAHSMGMKPSHIDNHMGTLYGNRTGRFGLLKLAYKICGSYGYAYRMFVKADKKLGIDGVPMIALKAAAALSRHWAKKYRVITPDYLLFPDWGAENLKTCENYETYREIILNIWINIPDGVTETFVHPALETDELKSITGSWRHRVWEYMLFKDPYTEKFLNSHGVTLISYRDLIRMSGGKNV